MLFKDLKVGDKFKIYDHTFMKTPSLVLERNLGGVEDWYEFNCVELKEGTRHIICDETEIEND